MNVCRLPNVALGFVGPVSGQRFEPPEVVQALSWVAIPAAVAIAVVRDRLYDLGLFVNRTLVAVVAGAALAAIYFAMLFMVGAVLGQTVSLTAANLAAAGAVAIISLPAVTIARRRITRWLGRGTTPSTIAEWLQDAARTSTHSSISPRWSPTRCGSAQSVSPSRD